MKFSTKKKIDKHNKMDIFKSKTLNMETGML